MGKCILSNGATAYKSKNCDAINEILEDQLYQRLFRLFLFFSAESNQQQQNSEVVHQTNVFFSKNGRLLSFITTTQAKFLVNQMIELVGKLGSLLPAAQSQPCEKRQQVYQFPAERMTFRDLIECCESFFPLRKQLESSVDFLFERYIQQIVRKGFVMCRRIRRRRASRCNCLCGLSPSSKVEHNQGYLSAGRWRSYWCILLPGNICLWPLNKAEKASKKHRKRLLVDHNTEIEVGAFDGDRFVWEVRTSKHCFQFAHFDQLQGMQRQVWVSDMEIAVNNCHRSELAEFDRQNSKQSCSNNLKKNWQRARSSSSRILLESDNRRLANLLDTERKALYDEEIVRQLATRMLDEEAERSDSFRRTIQFLSDELEYERNHRLFLEKRLYEAVEIAEQSAIQEPFAYDSGVVMGDEKIKRPNLDYLIISTQSV